MRYNNIKTFIAYNIVDICNGGFFIEICKKDNRIFSNFYNCSNAEFK